MQSENLQALLLTALAAVAWLSGCGQKPEARLNAPIELPAAQVQVRAAESRKQITTEEVVGTVRAKLRATLEARLSGRIDKMPVLLGQTIKAGQLLASLDALEIKARLEQAQAALQQADRDWKRISSLFENQTITRSECDAAEARQRVAKATVAEAQAMMSYVEILAPFAGVVTKKWADTGDLAAPGKPLLELEDPSALQLEADVPEAIASRIQSGSSLNVRLDSITGELAGTVSEIAPSTDPATRTLRVKLDLPRTAGLMSGQFARLVVPIGENSCLHVPVSAVLQRGQLEIAFVVGNQRAQLHLVKTGRRIGDEIEILSGLDAGDVVVTGGAALLTDGQPVEAK